RAERVRRGGVEYTRRLPSRLCLPGGGSDTRYRTERQQLNCRRRKSRPGFAGRLRNLCPPGEGDQVGVGGVFDKRRQGRQISGGLLSSGEEGHTFELLRHRKRFNRGYRGSQPL